MKMLKPKQHVATVKGWVDAGFVRVALKVQYDIDVHLLSSDANDTIFSYMLLSEKKIPARLLKEAQAFIAGIVYARR